MSWGIGSWGIGSYSGANFYITNHMPFDNTNNNIRRPTISFLIVSSSNVVDTSSIDVTANGIQFIVNGVFSPLVTGSIDDTDPNNVLVTINVLHSFSQFEVISVIVDVTNSANEVPGDGTTWQFEIGNFVSTFYTYIVRKFERVFKTNVSGLEAPQNPSARVELDPPELMEA